MGVAAYNRGTKSLAAQIAAEARAPEFALMDSVNNMPRNLEASPPFGPVMLCFSHGGCWVECPVTGFGYWYPSLRDAVRAWLIDLVAYDATTNTWRAEPRAA